MSREELELHFCVFYRGPDGTVLDGTIKFLAFYEQVMQDLERFNQQGQVTWPGSKFEAYRMEKVVLEGCCAGGRY
jgi:hypothetical protein